LVKLGLAGLSALNVALAYAPRPVRLPTRCLQRLPGFGKKAMAIVWHLSMPHPATFHRAPVTKLALHVMLHVDPITLVAMRL